MKRKKKTGGPDGLEAWCVALSASFINFVMAGLGRMSGILFVAFIEIFQVDRMQASVPFSARSLTRNLLGPVVGIVGQKYGVRTATLLGGILGTISAAVCFYGNSILWITIMWGIINGIGTALTITLPQVILSLHFKKYRTTASGLAFSGGCVGSFLFPALLEYLLHTYGLGGTFLILSGIIMNVIPAAMILNKPSWLHDKKSDNPSHVSSNNKALHESSKEFKYDVAVDSPSKFAKEVIMIQSNEQIDNKRLWFIGDTEDDSFNNITVDTEFLRQNNRFITLLLTTSFGDRHSVESETCLSLSTYNLQKELEDLYSVIEEISTESFVSKSADVEFVEYARDLENDSRHLQKSNDRREMLSTLKRHTKAETREIIFVIFKRLLREDRKNIVALFPEDEHRNISKVIDQLRVIYQLLLECEDYRETASDNDNLKTSADNSEKCEKSSPEKQHSNTFSAHIRTAFRLHTNPMFLLISLCRSVHFLTFVPAVTIIVDFSMDKGLLEEDGKYVIAALSLGDLMGRLCLGWVTDKELIKLPRYMLLVMVMQGICTASLSFLYSKLTLLSGITLFGLLQGSLFVRHPVLVSKYLDSHEQSVAMGCFNFLSGLLGFTLPSYIGYFRDTVGSYDYIFYINGTIGTVVGILWFFEPLFVRCIDRNKENNA